MAAYAALVSVMHIIDQLKLHPRPPISLDKHHAQCLTEKVTLLQAFLEGYSHVNSKEVDALESRIADAAHAAEDAIESHIADQILAGSSSNGGEKISSVDFYQGLQKVIEDLDSIKKEAMEIKENMGVRQDQWHRSSSLPAGSSRSVSRRQERTKMVGFDDGLIDLMDKLTFGELARQIIPIVGMGGSGKTTLARNIYEHQVIVEHFDIRAWGTISQEYSIREILVEIRGEKAENMCESEIGEKLYKKLCGKKYLIILDDIWDIEVWYGIKLFFPDNNNASRIILTTRLSTLASQLTNFPSFKMNFLSNDLSWNLLCEIVFGNEGCPPQLVKIGKLIAKNCKGLPLSIVVVGGILAKSEQTHQYWGHIADNLNSFVNLDDNEQCLQILYTSYNVLPAHLKPCFLYMGVVREDRDIAVSRLTKLWVAEGFLKPIDGKSLEEAAKHYLKEIIDRNLILVHEYGWNGKIKSCRIHDLLRDLCLREVQKQKFLCLRDIQSFDTPEDLSREHRICIYESSSKKKYSPEILAAALESASRARSLIWETLEPLPPFRHRLLRVSIYRRDGYSQKVRLGECSLEHSFQQVNLRYLSADDFPWWFLYQTSSSVSLCWSLQTLMVHKPHWRESVKAPSEIWEMPLLKHVDIHTLVLPDPPSSTGQADDIVLENLQTLSWIKNFRCSEEVVKRIPNLRKLKIYINEKGLSLDLNLNNIRHLHKLETFLCKVSMFQLPSYMVLTSDIALPSDMALPSNMAHTLTFPLSLKKLTLEETQLQWEELTTKIGSLPHLEVLKLKFKSCIGPHWETVDGQFCSLKYLSIDSCFDLVYWLTTDHTHFPRLEHLLLRSLKNLEEIPSSLGHIPTLLSIQWDWHCSKSAAESARRIREEQTELGNEDLKVEEFWFGMAKKFGDDGKDDEDEEDDDHEEDDEDEEDDDDEEDEWSSNSSIPDE